MKFDILKKLISLQNAVAALLIGSGWGALSGISSSTPGFRFLGITLIVMGVALFILSCGSKFEPEWDLATECCSRVLSVVATAFGIFVLVVSVNSGGESIPGRSYKQYKLELYSKWMQHKVNNVHNWETYYKKAIVEANVCNKFSKEYEFDTLDVIHTTKVTPFESSCCMPPEDCGFNYKNATVWIEPEKDGGNYTNLDCNRWDNDPNTLCYDCESCKAAFLQDVTTHYFYSGIALLMPAIEKLIQLLWCSCTLCTVVGFWALITGIPIMIDSLRRMISNLFSSNDDTYYLV